MCPDGRIATTIMPGWRSTSVSYTHLDVYKRQVYEDSFPEPKSKPFTYVDDEYAERAIRCSRTYYEYAKDICENYRMDLRRYKLIRDRKQYIGVSNREAYQAMCEDLAFAQQSLKTVLNDYADLFRKRFSEGLSIRKAADAMQQNRGVIERRQAALYRASVSYTHLDVYKRQLFIQLDIRVNLF